ncbi:hypothetical protein CAPTEDRAFT_211589, partial [Capitella teleta]
MLFLVIGPPNVTHTCAYTGFYFRGNGSYPIECKHLNDGLFVPQIALLGIYTSSNQQRKIIRENNKMKALLILSVLAVVALATARIRRRQGDSKPNIIWFFADDYGYQDAGYRNSDIHTPNIDQL